MEWCLLLFVKVKETGTGRAKNVLVGDLGFPTSFAVGGMGSFLATEVHLCQGRKVRSVNKFILTDQKNSHTNFLFIESASMGL